jgi:hypothetical protein
MKKGFKIKCSVIIKQTKDTVGTFLHLSKLTFFSFNGIKKRV